jgi:hypothetical protein
VEIGSGRVLLELMASALAWLGISELMIEGIRVIGQGKELQNCISGQSFHTTVVYYIRQLSLYGGISVYV